MARSENFMTVAEYARRHGFTMGYVYQLVWTRRLRARKVDGVWRIHAATPISNAAGTTKVNSGLAEVHA